MPTAGYSHDITIANSDSTTNKRGFMLARRNGQRRYGLADYRTLVPRQLTMGELTAAEFPVEIEALWAQENWQAGMGLVNQRLGNGQYGIAQGVKMDCSSPSGIIRVARELISPTAPATAPDNYKPSGFAQVGTEIWAFVGRDVYTWDYTNKLWVIGTEPLAVAHIYRNGVVLGDYTYAPSWVATNDAPARYMYKQDSDANWTLMGITAAVAFKYMARVASTIWAGYGDVYTDSTHNLNANLTNSQTDVLVTPTSPMYIKAGDVIVIESEAMLVASESAGTLTVTRAYWGTTAATHATGLDVYRLKVGRATNEVRSTTATPASAVASWSAATTIGDTSATITAMVTYHDGTNELVLICKEDGIWTINAAGTNALLYDMKPQQHVDNFRGAASWDGNSRVILPLGPGGMLELYQDVVTDISFSKTMPDQTHLHGRVVAVTADSTRVFVLVQDTTNLKYHLMQGERVSIGGVTAHRWHHVASVTYTTDTVEEHIALFADGVPSGSKVHHRILVGVESTGSNLLPYFYPLENDAEVIYTNDTDALAITVVDDRQFPNANKHYTEIVFTTKNLGASDYWEVQYRVDGGSWTYVTGAQATSKLTTSPQTLTFQVGVTGKKIELKFIPTVATTSASPEILDFTVKAQLRPATLKSLPLALYLANGQLLLNGSRQWKTKDDLTQLRAWNAQADAVKVTVPTYGGNESYTMVFLPGTYRETEMGKRPHFHPEYLIEALLAEA